MTSKVSGPSQRPPAKLGVARPQARPQGTVAAKPASTAWVAKPAVRAAKLSAAQLDAVKDNWAEHLSRAPPPRAIKETALPRGSPALATYGAWKERGETSVQAYKARLHGVDTYVLSRGSMGGGTTAYLMMFNASGKKLADGYVRDSGDVFWR